MVTQPTSNKGPKKIITLSPLYICMLRINILINIKIYLLRSSKNPRFRKLIGGVKVLVGRSLYHFYTQEFLLSKTKNVK